MSKKADFDAIAAACDDAETKLAELRELRAKVWDELLAARISQTAVQRADEQVAEARKVLLDALEARQAIEGTEGTKLSDVDEALLRSVSAVPDTP